MTNNEKLEALRTFLIENKIAFSPYKGKLAVTPELFIPKYKIMVKLSEGKDKDDEFFHTVKRKYRPLFIRDTDSVDFVLEKMQNLIIDIMKVRHNIRSKKLRKQTHVK